jgi:F-box-like
MDDRLEGSLLEMDHARGHRIINKPLRRTSFLLRRATTANWCDIGRVTIDILPDDVLLDIFDCYVTEAGQHRKYEEWQMLVHVCQKWRYVVFRSPLRLNLGILCKAETPVREKLAVWPPLPIIIEHQGFSISKCGEDNIIAALGHNDRVCEIDLAIPRSLRESVLRAMQKTFVELKDLCLDAMDGMAPALSDSFLGGSAPHLRRLLLTRIPLPFPVLRKLPLSAPNLIILCLADIPHSGYVSPGEMVTCLSALTRLEEICIGFKSPRSRPPREGRHPLPTRSVFPALTELTFIGFSEYSEYLVTRIDAPLLNRLYISFSYQVISDTPQLVEFISRTPKLKTYDEARVIISGSLASITLPGRDRDNLGLQLAILCRRSDRQLSSLVQVCASTFPQAFIPMLEHLYILEDISLPPLWPDDLGNNYWLELFRPFTTVKNLYLSREIVPHIVPTL